MKHKLAKNKTNQTSLIQQYTSIIKICHKISVKSFVPSKPAEVYTHNFPPSIVYAFSYQPTHQSKSCMDI